MNLMALALVIILLTIIPVAMADEEPHGHMFEPFWESLVIKPIIRGAYIATSVGWWLEFGDGTSFVKNFNRVILYNPPTEGILPFLNILLLSLIHI